jgi:hypothetical protein
LWALVLTKDHLLEYLGSYGLADSAVELYQQQELDKLIGHFFDRDVCYTAAGYERQALKKKDIRRRPRIKALTKLLAARRSLPQWS